MLIKSKRKFKRKIERACAPMCGFGCKKMKCNVDQVEAQVQDRHIEDIICLKLGVHLVVRDM
jgi:hypothetical protein